MKKVAVLLGGTSSEREVSLRSGEAVYQALLKVGYAAVKIDAGPSFVTQLLEEQPEVVFIALHGKLGEDGTLQGLLDILQIPYTGPGVLASAIGMNKLMTKRILVAEGIPTAPFMAVHKAEIQTRGISAVIAEIKERLPIPLVVKALTQGSTIGIYFVYQEKDLPAALKGALKYDDAALIEKMIQGTELTAAILGENPAQILPLIEITTTTGIYDYQTKYTPGMSHHLIPPALPAATLAKVDAACIKTYQAIGCRGYARVDCMVDEAGNPYILEVNTAPGLTETSLFPDAAKAAGLAFPELIRLLVEKARHD